MRRSGLSTLISISSSGNSCGVMGELKKRGSSVALARAMAAGYSSLTAETLPAWIQARPVEELQALASALRQDQLSHADWYTAMERWDRSIPERMDQFWKEHFAPATKDKPASGQPAKKAGP